MSTIATALPDGRVRIEWYGKPGIVRAYCDSTGITVDLGAVPWGSHDEADACLRDIRAIAEVYRRHLQPSIFSRLGPKPLEEGEIYEF